MQTADPSTPLRSGRDDTAIWKRSIGGRVTNYVDNFRHRTLVGFGVGDVDDGDLRGAALGGDRDHDAVFIFFAGRENGSVAGLDDRGLIAELFLVEGDDLVGGVRAEVDGGDHGAVRRLHVHRAFAGGGSGIEIDAEIGGADIGALSGGDAAAGRGDADVAAAVFVGVLGYLVDADADNSGDDDAEQDEDADDDQDDLQHGIAGGGGRRRDVWIGRVGRDGNAGAHRKTSCVSLLFTEGTRLLQGGGGSR